MARNKRRTRVVHVDAARQDGQPLQARDVDADPAGSAAAVEADLDAHAARTDNPHAVTAAQAGADTVGSAAAAEAAANAYTDSEIGTHAADADAHKGQKESIEIDAGDLHLVGDDAAPGANQVYGTDGAGAKGWKADPAGGSGLTHPQVLARVSLRG